jgi:hypothetical protein
MPVQFPPEFKNPPPVQNKARQAPEPHWAKDLIRRPNEWAVVERYGFDKTKANAMQQKISRGYWKWQEQYHGYWESMYREYDNGYEVYARYIP